jgi:hypothetical protein
LLAISQRVLYIYIIVLAQRPIRAAQRPADVRIGRRLDEAQLTLAIVLRRPSPSATTTNWCSFAAFVFQYCWDFPSAVHPGYAQRHSAAYAWNDSSTDTNGHQRTKMDEILNIAGSAHDSRLTAEPLRPTSNVPRPTIYSNNNPHAYSRSSSPDSIGAGNTSSAASTTSGSNWVPAQRRNSSRASSGVRAGL